jgi:tetratricopeptide (TPR) repeat protein
MKINDYTVLSVKQMKEADKKYQTFLEEELRKKPEQTSILIHLGVLAFICTHEHQKALNYFEDALRQDPKNTEALFWLASCIYHDYCEYDKAEKVILEAIKLNSKRSDCLCLMALICWHSHNDILKGINYLEQAIQYAPEWPMLRHLITTLYLKIDNVKSAEKHVKQAFEYFVPLAKRPTNAVEDYYERVVTGRSWTDLQEEFKPLLQRIEELKPRNTKSQSYLGKKINKNPPLY